MYRTDAKWVRGLSLLLVVLAYYQGLQAAVSGITARRQAVSRAWPVMPRTEKATFQPEQGTGSPTARVRPLENSKLQGVSKRRLSGPPIRTVAQGSPAHLQITPDIGQPFVKLLQTAQDTTLKIASIRLDPTVTVPENPVTRSLNSSSVDTIAAGGLSTSLSSIVAGQPATLAATSVADPMISASTSVNAPSPIQFTPIRVNANGPAYVDAQGRVWSADSGFSMGCWFPSFGFAPPAGLNPIYADGWSCGGIQYQATLPNQDYLVTLKFADPAHASPGQRLLNVTINGTTVLSNIDVAANAGGQYKPWDVTVPVTVTSGQITILLTGTVDSAIINALEIVASNSLEVNPPVAALAERQSLQFSAIVAGVSGAQVTWSITPDSPGSISSSGLYTAPGSVVVPTTATVIATSVSNPSMSGTATVSLAPTDPDTVAPIRVNANGPAYVDAQGRVWSADSGFSMGCWFPSFGFAPPAGLDPIYADGWACGGITYQTTLPNMDYILTLKFADPAYASPGQRLFDVAINGNRVLSRIDVAANAGGQYKPWDVSVPVTVTNGQITVALLGVLDNAIINALEIVPAGSVEVHPQTATLAEKQVLQLSAITAGTTGSPVTWSIPSGSPGTVSSTGLYAAPNSVAAPTAVTVTATNASNPNLFGTASVNLVPIDPNAMAPIRINANGPAHVDAQGRTWSADSGFSMGCWFPAFSFSAPPEVDSIYADGWFCGGIQYQATLPNMEYIVTLKFADPAYANPGQRLFDVAINGNRVLSRVDVAANAGGQYKPWDISIPVTVTNGQITISFLGVVDNAIINALEIMPIGAVEVLPSTANVWPGQSRQFAGKVASPTDTSLLWQIAPSGFGSISSTGLYAAPAVVATGQTVTITATSAVNPNWSNTAVVNLFPSAAITLGPQVATLTPSQTQQFTATVTNATDTSVQWSIQPGFGTITPSGLYTAPASIFTPQTITLTATSVFDPTKQASATIRLVPLISLSVSPQTVSLAPLQTQQFGAVVNGTWNNSVTWSTSPQGVGTISSSGLYTAPATIPAATSLTVTATSVANASVSASARVNLVPAPSNVVGIAPASVVLGGGGTQQFQATVGGAPSTAVTWSVMNGGAGTISPTGLYTAPASVTTPQSVTVRATSTADTTQSALAIVNLAPQVTVAVQPQAVTLTALQTQQFVAAVAGSANTAVTWNIVSGMGSVSPTGLYTAPGLISAASTVTLQATSVQDPTRSATVIVNLSPATTVSGSDNPTSPGPDPNAVATVSFGGAADPTDPYVVAQAAALNNDPAQIYAFVRDQIGFEVYHGSLRGARGTLWSKAGNSLDRASLLIALLGASGITAQYVEGTLPVEKTQQLILSMFTSPSRVTGCPPKDAQLADPANDPQLLADAGDHFWVEYGSSSIPMDPSFPDNPIGQAVGTATNRFASIPNALRHRVIVHFDVEEFSQLQFDFTGNGFFTTTAAQQTFDTTDLVGRPITLGNFVSSGVSGGIIATGSYRYLPYLRVGLDPADPDHDAVLQGQTYQESYTAFSVGSVGATLDARVLTGAWLRADVIDSATEVKSYEHTVMDRMGYAARHGYALPPTNLIPADQSPAFTELNVTSLSVLPGLQNPAMLGAYQARMQLLAAKGAALFPSIQQINLSAPSAFDMEVLKQGMELVQQIADTVTRSLSLRFLVTADAVDQMTNQAYYIKSYRNSPGLLVASNRPTADGAGFTIALNRMKDDIQAIAPPSQVTTAPFQYRTGRGLLEASIEQRTLAGFATADPGVAQVSLGPIDVFKAVDNQGISLVPIIAATSSDIDNLAISDDAKARIADALQRGQSVLVPAQTPIINGTPAMFWIEQDPVTGEMTDTTEDGSHQSILEYDELVKYIFKYPAPYMAKALGYAYGFLGTPIVGYLAAAETVAADPAATKAELVQAVQSAVDALENRLKDAGTTIEDAAKQVKDETGTSGLITTFLDSFQKGIDAAKKTSFYLTERDPAAFDTVHAVVGLASVPSSPGSVPSVSVAVSLESAFTVPLAGAELPLAFRAQITNQGPATDRFALNLSNVPNGFTVIQSLPSVTIPAGQTGEIGVCLVPTGPIPPVGSSCSFSAGVASSTTPGINATGNASCSVPPVQGLTVSAEPTILQIPAGSTVNSTLTVQSVGNASAVANLTSTSSPLLTVSGLQPTVTLQAGQSSTQTLTLTADPSAPLNSILSTTINATFGTSNPPQTPDQPAAIRVRIIAPDAKPAYDIAAAVGPCGRADIAANAVRFGDAITNLAANLGDDSAKTLVLFYLDHFITLMNTPDLAGVAAGLITARSNIANATAGTMQSALDSLLDPLTALKTILSAPAECPFDVSLSPNAITAQPNVSSTFAISIANRSSATQTYDLSVSGVPAGVNYSLSQSSITLDPGQVPQNVPTLSLTPTGAISTFEFTVTAALDNAPGISKSAKGTLTARNEFLSVQAVTASPKFIAPGGVTDVRASIANIVNQSRMVNVGLTVKNGAGQAVSNGQLQSVQLSILSLLTTVDFGFINIQALPAGNYTLEVAVSDPATGQVLPGGRGTGELLIGLPVTATLTVNPQIVPTGDSQVTTRLSVQAGGDRDNPLILLGSAQTPSAAQSVAVNGNTAYVCDNNEVSVLDVSNPANPQLLNTAAANSINNSGDIRCSIQRNTLVAFADGVDSAANGSRQPAFVAFNLNNPAQPQLIQSSPIGARFFDDPVFAGNTAFVPTNLVSYCCGGTELFLFGTYGQVFAVDTTDFSNPRILGALLADPPPSTNPPDPTNATGPATGLVLGATLVPQQQLLYVTGARDPNRNSLIVADISNPAAMTIVNNGVSVPGMADVFSMMIQDNVAVAIGDSGGYNWPSFTGNIVISTLDITDPRNPVVLATTSTPYFPGAGGGKARIGDNLFLFAGVQDSSSNPLLLMVDTADPRNPSLKTYPIFAPVTNMVPVGNILHTTNGAAGYAAYQIPGITPIQFNAQIQVPKGTGVTYDPASFTTPPDSIQAGTAFDTLIWNNPAHSAISWHSTLSAMQGGEVRPVALGGTVNFSGAFGAGSLSLPEVSVAADQILSLTPPAQNVQAGIPATYMLNVKNPTASAVTYNLVLAGIPASWLPLPTPIAVPAGGYISVPLTLQTEATAASASYTFVITATAGGVQGSAQGQLGLTGGGSDPGGSTGDPRTYGVDVILNPVQVTLGRGTSAEIAVQVFNAGSQTDTYSVSAVVPTGIAATLDRASVQVQPGAIQQVNLHVTALPGSPVGLASVIVRAVSTTRSSILSEKTELLNIIGAGVTVALTPAASAPGGTLQLVVTNAGLNTDTFDLTLGGPVAAGATLAATKVTLAAGASQSVAINIGPVALAGGGSFPLFATATSEASTSVFAAASASIAIPLSKGLTVQFNPATQQLGAPGPAVFLLQVNNTGSVEDTYTATISLTYGPLQASLNGLDNQPTQTIPQFILPGESGGMLVLNTTLTGQGLGIVTVKVSSLSDATITATASARLSSGIIPDFSIDSSTPSAAISPGTVAAYPLAVAFDPGFGDTVGLTVSGLPNGATAVFSTASFSATGASVLTITTSGSTPPGTYPLTVVGMGNITGATHSKTLSLIVGTAIDYSITVAPQVQQVALGGGTVIYTVTAPPVNGFNGVIALSASGLPSGAIAVFTPSAIAGGSTSTLTITTDATTPLGNSEIVVTGTSGTVSRAAGAATLSVIIPPDFAVTSGLSSVTVRPGAKASYPITIATQGGFAGPVSLSVTGLPAGTTFTPNSAAAPGSAVLSVTTDATATPAGTYVLTISASSGLLVHVATATLVVNPAADYSISVTPATQTVIVGNSLTYNVTVTALTNFSGTINLSASGIPSGATAGFGTATFYGSGTTTMTVATTAATTIGSSQITVSGVSGTITRTAAPVTLNVNPAGDFSVASDGISRTVKPGSLVNFPLTVNFQNGFTGTVTLAATGLPAGTTAVISPSSVTTSGTALLTVTTAATTPAGSYTLTITGTGGNKTHTTGATVVIDTGADFSLAASPSTQSVAAGNSTSYTITATATRNFAGHITFSVSGMPAGATVSFSPATLDGAGTVLMTITTAISTPVGSSQITVTGASGSVIHTSSSVTLGVTAPADFSLASTAASQPLPQGGFANFGLVVTPLNNFTGTVILSASGGPSGATFLFTPATVTGTGTSSLWITVPGTTTPQSYAVTITGTSGSLQHSTTVNIVVQPVTVYEAEAPVNTLTGGAAVGSCTACSNSARVDNLGTSSTASGTLIFNQINVPTAGSYIVTIYFTNGDAIPRSANISVNGNTSTLAFIGEPTGSWSTVKATAVLITLNAGNNTIKFFNSTGLAPSLDRISVVTTPACAAVPLDLMLVIDRSGSMAGQPLTDAQNAAKAFVDSLQLATDQVGLVSYNSTATLNSKLTHNGTTVKTAISALTASGNTFIGSGLATATTELGSSRHNSAAQKVIVLLSDGDDNPANPNTATNDATAKAAGIRIITIGYGSGMNPTVLQSLATSSADFYASPTTQQISGVLGLIATSICRPPNAAPTVDAGPNQTVTLPGGATLSGAVGDDGLPASSTLTLNWTKVSGPGTVTFSNSKALSNTATFSVAGTYVLQLSASDSLLTGSATVTITVNANGTAAVLGSATLIPAEPASLSSVGQSQEKTGVTVFGVVNAASNLPGPVSPDEVVMIKGAGFGGPVRMASEPQTTLSGTQVLFDDTPASLLNATPNQLFVIVPDSVGGNATMVVTHDGIKSAPLHLVVAPATPGVFTAETAGVFTAETAEPRTALGSGQAFALNADGSRNSETNPAAAGSIVTLYVTGTGRGDKLEDSLLLLMPLQVLIADSVVEVISTAQSSTPGVVELRLRVPAWMPSGIVPVTVRAGRSESREDVTLAIH